MTVKVSNTVAPIQLDVGDVGVSFADLLFP